MKSELIYSEGDREKPLVIFIHGMGMNAAMWSDPARARILGGRYPLSILLDDAEPKTSFHDLKDLGYPVLAWSQKRPAGPAILAVEELKQLVRRYPGKSHAGIVLIGHSRGGIIARRFLQDASAPVQGVITVSAPHAGSTMAKWVEYVSPLSAALQKILDVRDEEMKSAVHRVVNFLNGKGIKEMLPGSDFLSGLSGERAVDAHIVSIGGTNPALIKIGKISLPAILSAIVSEASLPDEMREGKGDGFVSAAAAVYPGGDQHRNFYAHHAALIFDRGVRDYIRTVVCALAETE